MRHVGPHAFVMRNNMVDEQEVVSQRTDAGGNERFFAKEIKQKTNSYYSGVPWLRDLGNPAKSSIPLKKGDCSC